jgi:hypothetical protein
MAFTDSALSPIGSAVGETVAPSVQSALSAILPVISPDVVPVADRKHAVIRARLNLAAAPKRLGTGWRLAFGCLGFGLAATGAYLLFRSRFNRRSVRGRRAARGVKRLKLKA